jgi:hippurate hydrolase
VIAARIVVALQTVVSRENDPLEPAVVTVGSIHGGATHNVIPDEVKLQLTVRSYSPEVREKLLASIARIVKAEAMAANAPKEPLIAVERGPSATFNDPALTKRLAAALGPLLGAASVVEGKARMGAEDFSEYGRAGVPAAILWVGAADPAKLAAAEKSGAPMPSLHSSSFAPLREPTLRTGVITLTGAALELLGK